MSFSKAHGSLGIIVDLTVTEVTDSLNLQVCSILNFYELMNEKYVIDIKICLNVVVFYYSKHMDQLLTNERFK